MRRITLLITPLVFAVTSTSLFGQVAVPAAGPGKCSVTWVGFEQKVEDELVTGKVVRLEAVPIGITKPQRATLESGVRFAFKPIRPSRQTGYWESYKSEIAAYKLDRLLEMHMVPPIMERKIDGLTGAAVLWVENVRGWSVASPPRGPEPMWSRQLTRMKMFDQLIANLDRNEGNLIYDADWHLILIDHSRAFIDQKDLKNMIPLGRVDRSLWEKMQALAMADLDRGLGKWIDTRAKRALLARRDQMAKAIAAMVKTRGEKSVFFD